MKRSSQRLDALATFFSKPRQVLESEDCIISRTDRDIETTTLVKQLAIIAFLLICHVATAQTPKAARYIELHFPFGKAHFLGAIPTSDQTGVRWKWIIETGFNVNYKTMPTPVFTWPNITLKDFVLIAACCADAETATLDVVKNYEQTKHTAVFYGNSGNEGNDQLDANQ